jgi:hypothetical protein
MKWSTENAEQVKARNQAVSDAGPCPNCGSPADVDMIIAPTLTPAGPESAWVPGEVRCSANCWLQDPDAYIAAVTGMRK